MPNNMPSQPEFPVVRRGFDPDSVDRYMAALQRELGDRVAAAEARYSNLETALAEAHQREEAVHLTLIAATKTKEEMLVGARQEAEKLISRSREQAEALLGEAKKEAFRLVTDARQTAQETTAAARASAEEARATAQASAESIRDKARLEAIEMINSVETDTTSLLAAREAALVEMRARYEEEEAGLISRIDVLRTAANDLETRLKAIAAGSLGATTHLVSDLPAPAPAPAQAPDLPVARQADPIAQPDRVPQPAPVSQAQPIPKARPPIRRELTEAYLSADQPEPVAATTTTPIESAAPAARASSSAPIMDEERAAEELAAAELAAAEEAAVAELAAADMRAIEMAQAKRRAAAVEMPANLNGHTYVEPIEDDLAVTAEEAEAEDTTVPEDDHAAAASEGVADDSDAARSEDPEVVVEPAASAESDEELDNERVPVAVGAVARPAPFEDDGRRKGSYYSRRSAKLPRIGNEAGRNALAAANAIRGASRGTPVDED